MDTLLPLLGKLLLLAAMMAAGALARHRRLVSQAGMQDLSRLLTDLFLPALIVSSLVGRITREQILDNLALPALAVLTGCTGWALGLGIARLNGWSGDRRRVLLYHAVVNNFVYITLPLVHVILPERGAPLLFLYAVGGLLMMWTLGVGSLTGGGSLRGAGRRLLTPGLVTALVSLAVVLLDLGSSVPQGVLDVFDAMAQPTIPISMVVAGAQIHGLGRRALRFDAWNLQLGLLRLLLVPALMLPVALLLQGLPGFSDEALLVFTLVSAAPVSVGSVGMAMRYGASPDFAAQGVLFSHLFGMPIILMFILLAKRLLLQT